MSPPFLASKIYTKEELCLLEERPRPCGIIIFGASGDLTTRKLLPSLLYLSEHHLMPPQFYVLGVGRTALEDASFRKKVEEVLASHADPAAVSRFAERCHYAAGDYADPAFYRSLAARLAELDTLFGTGGNRLAYLSTPPDLYPVILARFGEAGLSAVREGGPWVRVVIEKPFGDSLATARALNVVIAASLREDQIYRIDHYLGKETVQNILMFRFANILFEPVWNRNYIDHIQITAAEDLGIGHRAGYYERAGVLRDMLQNHLLQLLALIAMEPPTSLNADSVRDRKVDIFRAVEPWSAAELERSVVLGQYAAGTVDGKPVAAYRKEAGVAPDSRTPTFAAVRLTVDNWRWQGVPFTIRSGKRLARRLVEIAVHFKRVPISIFKPLLAEQLSPNVLTFRIQPDERIEMRFEAKHPGPKLCMSSVTMDFGYQETFGTPPPESYARLFQDAMLGDQTLYARSDDVEASWRIVDPIIAHAQNAGVLKPYAPGGWGPPESDALLTRDGRSWNNA